MTGDEVRERIRTHLLTSSEVKCRAAEACAGDISRAAELMVASLQRGGKILLCGNGGSAADCQHMAAEFVSRLTQEFERPGLPAIALTTDTSFLTAYTNDIGFEGVFARQVQALGREGDVLIGISTSGRSRNVVQALSEAKRLGITTVALTGTKGVQGDSADVTIRVPSDTTAYIQEAHLAIEHILCFLVERSLYGDGAERRE